MLATLIVLAAVLLAVLGLRAERHRRMVELWACNAAAVALLAATVVGHASGRIA
jgi:hypothetical protein